MSSVWVNPENNTTIDRHKLGLTKRHILTYKNNIPLYVIISPTDTHAINFIDAVNNAVIQILESSKSKKNKRR